jgi:hypothetical protein
MLMLSSYRRPHAIRRPGRSAACGCERLEGRLVLSGDITGGIPPLSSLPGAPANLYLDFDGDIDPIGVLRPPFDFDHSPGLSAGERAVIREAWARVAEQFSPFNLNVTTVDPGVDDIAGRTLHVDIGGTLGEGALGLAQLGTFTSGQHNRVWVSNLDSPLLLADVISHEAGHGFGLQHQSRFDANGNKTSEYRGVSGDVALVMGPITTKRVLWWTGPNSTGAD